MLALLAKIFHLSKKLVRSSDLIKLLCYFCENLHRETFFLLRGKNSLGSCVLCGEEKGFVKGHCNLKLSKESARGCWQLGNFFLLLE